MHIPGLKVVVPSTPADAKGLLTTAIFDDDPVLFVETGTLYGTRGPVPVEPFSIPFGEAVVHRTGTDVSIITYGRGLRESMTAAEVLAKDDISAEVIDLRTLVPMDVDTMLRSVSKTRRAVVVHGATRFAGPGAEISAIITENLFRELAAPVGRVGARYLPIPPVAELQAAVLPDFADVIESVRRTMADVAATQTSDSVT
jgi:pyruvate dehydrogenase E1 component beta subunit